MIEIAVWALEPRKLTENETDIEDEDKGKVAEKGMG